MKTLGLLHALLALTFARAEDRPVTVPATDSPNGMFSIRLTRNRAKETEFKRVERPEVQIVANADQKVLARFPYPAGTSSDGKPPHTKVRAQWCPDGTAVAISFAERFFTHLVVYRLEGALTDPKAFVAVRMPDRPSVIQSMVPRFKQFVPPWQESIRGWSGPNTIEFQAGGTAVVEPVGDGERTVKAVYSFSVDIADIASPVIKKVEPASEGTP